jgi:SM-20-related protein
MSLTDCEPPQFLRYEKGDFFVRHQDGNDHQNDFDHLRIRRISIVGFLSDSFTGGSLTFYDQTTTFPLMGETGLLVAFKSDIFHEVVPVTSGERFTFVSWFR